MQKPKHYENKIDPDTFAKNSFTKEELTGAYKYNINKYISRYKMKNGIQDLYKARDYLNWLIEMEENDESICEE